MLNKCVAEVKAPLHVQQLRDSAACGGFQCTIPLKRRIHDNGARRASRPGGREKISLFYDKIRAREKSSERRTTRFYRLFRYVQAAKHRLRLFAEGCP